MSISKLHVWDTFKEQIMNKQASDHRIFFNPAHLIETCVAWKTDESPLP